MKHIKLFEAIKSRQEIFDMKVKRYERQVNAAWKYLDKLKKQRLSDAFWYRFGDPIGKSLEDLFENYDDLWRIYIDNKGKEAGFKYSYYPTVSDHFA